MSVKPQMPKDTNNASIPVLTPTAKHELSLSDAQSASYQFVNPSSVVRLKTDAPVRFVFGTAGGSANSTSFLRDEYDTHEMRVPIGMTHLHLFGVAAANIYIEELG